MAFLWVCTMLASVLAALAFTAGMVGAKGAPQEASAAAIALCIAIIPYVFTRAIEGIGKAAWRRDMLAELKKQSAGVNPGVAAFQAAAASAPRSS